MHPVAGPGLGEPGAARRASSAERVILRILAHPEAEHDALLRMVGRPGTNNISHTSDVFPSALVAVPVLPAISPALSSGNASVRFFRSSGFSFQIASLNGSIPGITPLRSADAVPVGPMSSGAFRSSIIAADTAGCMMRSWWRRLFAFDVAFGRAGRRASVEQRLAVAADVVGEAWRHAKTAVEERRRRGHRQRIDFGCADRRRRIRLQHVLRSPSACPRDRRDRSRS